MKARASLIATTVLFAFAVGIGPALSEGNPAPSAPSGPYSPASDQKPGGSKATKGKSKKEKKSQQQFLDGYRVAYDLIQSGKYVEGIAAMHALGHDDHPDVANYIGFASRKLGRYDDAKYWYDKALAADPNHTRTLQYYGMWHLEQGNALKAKEHLEKIRAMCGTTCKEYVSLQEALNGNIIY
jgi:tetratricopeptide (TPR) repeat protein